MGISQFRGLMKHHNGIKLLNRNGTINYNQVLAQGFSNPNAYSPFGDRNYFSKGLVQPNGKVVLVKVTDSYPNNQVNSTSFFNFLICLSTQFPKCVLLISHIVLPPMQCGDASAFLCEGTLHSFIR
jgi:hypothetical protein